MGTLAEIGKEVLKKEAEALLAVTERLGDSFDAAVRAINDCSGRVVLTGIGKSGLISKKIASTFSSVGIPALYLHPADSLHGDLGMIQKGDVLLIVSNSGETEELIKILPWIKRMDITTVVFTGNARSTIAEYGDIVLDLKVDEACPFNIVPTCSTTVALAMGDALAIASMRERDFKVDDFALLHPGGALGRSLLLRVEDLMHSGGAFPKVYEDMPMKHVIIEVSSKRLGVAGVFNRDEELVGVITDGDLRRALERYENVLEKTARDVMGAKPKGIERDALAAHALRRMEELSITSLFVFEKDETSRPMGVVHIHDILKAKIV